LKDLDSFLNRNSYFNLAFTRSWLISSKSLNKTGGEGCDVEESEGEE
jgi:hypothetical protein